MVCNSFHWKEFAGPLHRCACAGVSAFGFMCVAALNRCHEHQCICRYVRYTGVTDISDTFANTLAAGCAYALSRECAVCSLALGDEGGRG